MISDFRCANRTPDNRPDFSGSERARVRWVATRPRQQRDNSATLPRQVRDYCATDIRRKRVAGLSRSSRKNGGDVDVDVKNELRAHARGGVCARISERPNRCGFHGADRVARRERRPANVKAGRAPPRPARSVRMRSEPRAVASRRAVPDARPDISGANSNTTHLRRARGRTLQTRARIVQRLSA